MKQLKFVHFDISLPDIPTMPAATPVLISIRMEICQQLVMEFNNIANQSSNLLRLHKLIEWCWPELDFCHQYHITARRHEMEWLLNSVHGIPSWPQVMGVGFLVRVTNFNFRPAHPRWWQIESSCHNRAACPACHIRLEARSTGSQWI